MDEWKGGKTEKEVRPLLRMLLLILLRPYVRVCMCPREEEENPGRGWGGEKGWEEYVLLLLPNLSDGLLLRILLFLLGRKGEA